MAEKREREEAGNGGDNGCGFNADAITSDKAENIGSADCITDSKNASQESSATAASTDTDKVEDAEEDDGAAVTGSASKKQKTKPTVSSFSLCNYLSYSKGKRWNN